MTGFYCGIDLGAKSAHVCVVDAAGAVVLQRKLDCDASLIIEQLKKFESIRIVVESTFNWYWLVDALNDAGFDVVLAHTVALRAITHAKVKTDKRDAKALAQLLRLDAIPKAYIYPKEQRYVRDLLRRRLALVRKRGDEYGSLRRLLMRHGHLDHSRDSITRVNNDELKKVFPERDVLAAAEQQLERVALYDKQIDQLEERVLLYTHTALRDDLRRLTTLPGVSTVLGLTILYETGPIERFATARNYSSYARVVAGTFQSGTVLRRRGFQSKQGNTNLKWAFNQAALHAVRNYPVVRLCFDKHLTRHAGKPGKLIAYNTIAHKIAVATFRMLRDKTNYDPTLIFGEEVAKSECEPGTVPGSNPLQ